MEFYQYLTERLRPELRKVGAKSEMFHRHAAVILDKNLNVICSGYNYRTPYGSCHAEVAAIQKWLRAYRPRSRDAYMVFVARLNRTDLTFSKPCDACQATIEKFGLKVEYTRYFKPKNPARKTHMRNVNDFHN